MLHVQNGFRPINCAFVFDLSIDAILILDGDIDTNANVKCEQSLGSYVCFTTLEFFLKEFNVNSVNHDTIQKWYWLPKLLSVR